jgi:hypothetical protein
MRRNRTESQSVRAPAWQFCTVLEVRALLSGRIIPEAHEAAYGGISTEGRGSGSAVPIAIWLVRGGNDRLSANLGAPGGRDSLPNKHVHDYSDHDN